MENEEIEMIEKEVDEKDVIADIEEPVKTDVEKKLEELEQRENEIIKKEKLLEKQNKFKEKNIDIQFMDYLKDDIDIEEFSKLIKKNLTNNSFVPIEHTNSNSVSNKEWNKMTYSEKEEVYKTNPSLAKRLLSKSNN